MLTDAGADAWGRGAVQLLQLQCRTKPVHPPSGRCILDILFICIILTYIFIWHPGYQHIIAISSVKIHRCRLGSISDLIISEVPVTPACQHSLGQ